MKRTVRWRWTRTLATFALLLPWLLGAIIAVGMPSAEGDTKRVQTWNVHGDDEAPGSDGPFGLEKMNFVAFVTLNAEPASASLALQEVCWAQAERLASLLSASSYEVNWLTTKTESWDQCSGYPDKRKGNLVAVRGDSTDVWYADLYPLQSDETRRLLCGEVSTPWGPHAGCSTHLDNDVGNAQQQNSSARLTALFALQNLQHFVGADLNLTPGQDAPDGPPWPSYVEVNWLHQKTFNSNGPLDRKLDWAMGDSNHHSEPWGSPDCNQTQYSDHCSLSGVFEAK